MMNDFERNTSETSASAVNGLIPALTMIVIALGIGGWKTFKRWPKATVGVLVLVGASIYGYMSYQAEQNWKATKLNHLAGWAYIGKSADRIQAFHDLWPELDRNQRMRAQNRLYNSLYTMWGNPVLTYQSALMPGGDKTIKEGLSELPRLLNLAASYTQIPDRASTEPTCLSTPITYQEAFELGQAIGALNEVTMTYSAHSRNSGPRVSSAIADYNALPFIACNNS